MIEVKMRFWTNHIAEAAVEIMTRHARSAGVVCMEPSQSHGIVPEKPVPLHSLLDVGGVIEKLLIARGIVLYLGRHMKKYLKVDAEE